MEESQITLHNVSLEDVMRYLYDQVRMMGWRTIEYTNLVEYPDGTSNKVTYMNSVQNVQPPKNNRIEVRFHYAEYPEGKIPSIPWDNMPGIELEGWQLQTNTVLIKAEFVPLFRSFVDGFFDDLKKTFEQVIQPELNTDKRGEKWPEDPTDARIWKHIKEDIHLSDGQIAQRIGISRQAVWGRRKAMQKAGYKVR